MTTDSRFGIKPGRVLASKYVVDEFLGSGWEGEVYLVTEQLTGAQRAAKLFFPERNPRNKSVLFYARKLEKLRDCRMVIQYHHSEKLRLRGEDVHVLFSEFVEGAILADFIKEQPGKRMQPYAAMHLLRALAAGLAEVHERREYHGDLHTGNILVSRRGVHFDARFVDLYDWGRATKAHIQSDVMNLVRVFHEAVGGSKHYAGQPAEVKHICAGLKNSLIATRFPDAWALVRHLDTFEWDD
ncbi:MAG: serine/threonine-protein kinase [Phycisphaerales bacterium]